LLDPKELLKLPFVEVIEGLAILKVSQEQAQAAPN
jgi:hypothetical protein